MQKNEEWQVLIKMIHFSRLDIQTSVIKHGHFGLGHTVFLNFMDKFIIMKVYYL